MPVDAARRDRSASHSVKGVEADSQQSSASYDAMSADSLWAVASGGRVFKRYHARCGRPALTPRSLLYFLQERPCVLEVRGIESFSVFGVNRRDQSLGLLG